MENGHWHREFSHKKRWFSIARLNYQRVYIFTINCGVIFFLNMMGFDRIRPTKMDQTLWQYVSQFAKPWRCLARKSSAKGSFVQANDCLPEGKQFPLPDTNGTVVLELGCFRNPQSCCQLTKVWTRSIIPFNYTYVHVCYPCFFIQVIGVISGSI